jgi:hypothetical protein
MPQAEVGVTSGVAICPLPPQEHGDVSFHGVPAPALGLMVSSVWRESCERAIG